MSTILVVNEKQLRKILIDVGMETCGCICDPEGYADEIIKELKNSYNKEDDGAKIVGSPSGEP